MQVAVIIPDRGDRPEFTKNCHRMMEQQTRPPDRMLTVNFPPVTKEKDITARYRIGYKLLDNTDFDVAFLIENDDWYAPNYIAYMLEKWEEVGRPELFGTNYTIYYHIQLRRWFRMDHYARSAAMNTMIKPGLNIEWPQDLDPYCDMHLWINNKQLGRKVTFGFDPLKKKKDDELPEDVISIGIKHGVGLCGGNNHLNRLDRFINTDHHFALLQRVMDRDSFRFYSNQFTPEIKLHD